MKAAIMTLLLIWTSNVFSQEAEMYLCDEKSDIPSIISVRDNKVIQIQDNFYNSKCDESTENVNANTKIEELKNLAEAEKDQSSKNEINLVIDLYSNNMSECLKFDPPSVVSFDQEKNVLTQLNLKRMKIEKLQCKSMF